MRRSFLILTALSFSAWAQSALAPAQPPIVVQVQMPPTTPLNFWRHAFDLAVPGFIGGLSAWIAVWLTSRNNERANAQNRKHDLEKLTLEHSFALKRDVLVRVTQALGQTFTAMKDWHHSLLYLEQLEVMGDDHNEMKHAEDQTSKEWELFWQRKNELEQATASMGLAVSNELWNSAKAVAASIAEARVELVNRKDLPANTFDQLSDEITTFTKAAQDELHNHAHHT
jgi:hypothetical protein